MLWLTPTLFLFEVVLPGTTCCVEVQAEWMLRRLAEQNEWGRPLQPEEQAHIVLHSVLELEGGLPATGLAAFEVWLENLAEQHYHEANGRKFPA